MLIDLRVYTLHPGTRARFTELVRDGTVPMLREWGVSVVAFGPSGHDEDSFALVRSFASMEQRKEQLTAFYGSAEWNDRFDTEIMSMIKSYETAVLPGSAETVAAWQAALSS